MIFKVLLIQHLHNLSDDAMEYQLFHRLSFRHSTGCDECKVHDAKIIWLYRERLTKSEKEQELSEQFYLTLAEKGLLAHQGQIVDAPFVESPKQRNTREENQQIKKGKIPTDWNTAKPSQKDRDTGWTRENQLTLVIQIILYSSKIKLKPRQLYLQPQNSVLSNLRLAS